MKKLVIGISLALALSLGACTGAEPEVAESTSKPPTKYCEESNENGVKVLVRCEGVTPSAPSTEGYVTSRPQPQGNGGSVAQSNAVEMAQRYLSVTAFSRSGLVDQLIFEGFSSADATYAVDAVGADWNRQAALKAEQYLDISAFSRSGLIDQLIFEGFTPSQAAYGVSAVGL